MQKTRVKKVGEELGVTLAREVLEQLGTGEGDDIYLIPSPLGIILSKENREAALQSALGQKIIEQYPETLNKLAQ